MNEVLLWSAIFFRALGIVLFLFGVLPKMWKATKVPNGLGFLRKSLFIIAIIWVITQGAGLTTFLTNPVEVQGVIEIIRNSIYFNSLSFMNGLGVFLIEILMFLIYTRDYTHKHRF